MNRVYYDTAYLVKLYCREAGSDRVLAHADEVDSIHSCCHARAELIAALHRKHREGSLLPTQIREILNQFRDDLESGFITLHFITNTMFDRLEAAFDSAPQETYLRAADALHLACAADLGFIDIHSNDRHLLMAAKLFDLNGLNLLSATTGEASM